jgi:hypothetical protein
MSLQESILAGVQTALAALASGRVYRDRREGIGTLPAISIEPESCEEQEIVIGKVDGVLVVAVGIYAAGETPSTAADGLAASVKSILVAGKDFGLGSDVQLMPGVSHEWDFENYDFVRLVLRYRVQYRS